MDLFRLVLPREADLRAEHRAGLLGGVTVVRGKALADAERPVTLTAVPCYAWANREKGAMTVWIGEVPSTKPRLAAFVSAAYNDADPPFATPAPP